MPRNIDRVTWAAAKRYADQLPVGRLWNDVEKRFTITQFFNIGAATDLTIATGAVTITGSHHRIDTEAAAATDNLDTISGGTSGDILLLRSVATARVVTLKAGVDNLRMPIDFALDNILDIIGFVYIPNVWFELFRSNNA